MYRLEVCNFEISPCFISIFFLVLILSLSFPLVQESKRANSLAGSVFGFIKGKEAITGQKIRVAPKVINRTAFRCRCVCSTFDLLWDAKQGFCGLRLMLCGSFALFCAAVREAEVFGGKTLSCRSATCPQKMKTKKNRLSAV